ncbi:MAG: pyridoxamine 5'-phosphate oxidase family protein [Planctomycetota bacterium]
MITDLAEFLDLAWTHLVRGVKDRKHGFHQPVLATVQDGKPRARTVVLRKVDREQGLILCHTDRRSGKIGQSPGGVEWCFYDRKSRLQVRAAAAAEVLTEGPVFEERWNASRLASRRCYLAPHVPGSEVAEAHPNLPDHLRDRDPTQEESEAGRDNFAVFLTRVERLDVLHLAHDGHSRAAWTLDPAGPSQGVWVAP